MSKPRTVAARRQIGEVGDAAEIDDDAMRVAAEERGVERRHQRRALAARRDVAAAEIGDDGHAGPLGDARRVVELQRPAFVGAMAQRLAVDARGDDVRAPRDPPRPSAAAIASA